MKKNKQNLQQTGKLNKKLKMNFVFFTVCIL